MYNNFFGFKEKPFTLVPNPEYIFRSRSHEDAFSHLSYAISEGNGFAKITGKVGSGKTLLCRTFLESLDDSVKSAYILNPKLDAIQLMKVINDEFKINSSFDNTKDLINELNKFLIRQGEQNKKVILIIDEAQNLSVDALEQIRLLSNLETIKNKLLQIVLVGQTELDMLLDRYELRQLSQRISLSCDLSALSFAETVNYIKHRLHIASRRSGDFFSNTAMREVFEFSKGIPRLINIACDRMLLTAYSENSRKVTKKIAKKVIAELIGKSYREFSITDYKEWAVALLALPVIFFAIFLFYNKTESPKNIAVDSITKKTPSRTARAPIINTNKNIDRQKPENQLTGKLYDLFSNPAFDQMTGASVAAENLITIWDTEMKELAYAGTYRDAEEFFTTIGEYNGFQVKRTGAEVSLLNKLNLPAVLEFKSAQYSTPKFLVLTGITVDRDSVELSIGDKVLKVSPKELYDNRFSYAYVFWKDFFKIRGTIPYDIQPNAISTLKMILRGLGFSEIIANSVYDEYARDAVKAIQLRHNLSTDGVVGSLTKIVIYNEMETLNIPHIRK